MHFGFVVEGRRQSLLARESLLSNEHPPIRVDTSLKLPGPMVVVPVTVRGIVPGVILCVPGS
jgi:hypothetical protein